MQTPRQVLSAALNVKIDTNNITSTILFESEDGRVTFSLTNHEAAALVDLFLFYGESIKQDIKDKNEELEIQAARRLRQQKQKKLKYASVDDRDLHEHDEAYCYQDAERELYTGPGVNAPE